MYLFFDTETTGLPRNWGAPINDFDNWPRLVQLAWILFDEKGIEMDSNSRIIKPENFLIPVEASSVHGITTKKALEEGIELLTALEEFSRAINSSGIIIAHNMSFDEKIIGAEILRKSLNTNFFETQKFCTMVSTAKFCGIENQYGYKWPRLAELHQKLFGCEFENAHDALADVKACARCFFELRDRGVI